jgi:hypothetical protein
MHNNCLCILQVLFASLLRPCRLEFPLARTARSFRVRPLTSLVRSRIARSGATHLSCRNRAGNCRCAGPRRVFKHRKPIDRIPVGKVDRIFDALCSRSSADGTNFAKRIAQRLGVVARLHREGSSSRRRAALHRKTINCLYLHLHLLKQKYRVTLASMVQFYGLSGFSRTRRSRRFAWYGSTQLHPRLLA